MTLQAIINWAAAKLPFIKKAVTAEYSVFVHYKGSYHMIIDNLLATDGVNALTRQIKLYWFLELIESYQHEMQPGNRQIWTLERITSDDVLVEVKVGKKPALTGFGFGICLQVKKVTVWVEENVMHLPNEK